MQHLIDILQLSEQEIDELIQTAEDIIKKPGAYGDSITQFSEIVCP